MYRKGNISLWEIDGSKKKVRACVRMCVTLCDAVVVLSIRVECSPKGLCVRMFACLPFCTYACLSLNPPPNSGLLPEPVPAVKVISGLQNGVAGRRAVFVLRSDRMDGDGCSHHWLFFKGKCIACIAAVDCKASLLSSPGFFFLP